MWNLKNKANKQNKTIQNNTHRYRERTDGRQRGLGEAGEGD